MKLTAFDRAAITEQLKVIFKPVEELLPVGDAFDYEKANVASCHLQGTLEGVVWLPLTEDSLTSKTILDIKAGDEWPGAMPFAGFYAIQPNECFRDIEADMPYLVWVTEWDKGHVENANGVYVRDAQVEVCRPISEPNYVYFSGNTVYHVGCVKVTMNQA